MADCECSLQHNWYWVQRRVCYLDHVFAAGWRVSLFEFVSSTLFVLFFLLLSLSLSFSLSLIGTSRSLRCWSTCHDMLTKHISEVMSTPHRSHSSLVDPACMVVTNMTSLVPSGMPHRFNLRDRPEARVWSHWQSTGLRRGSDKALDLEGLWTSTCLWTCAHSPVMLVLYCF